MLGQSTVSVGSLQHEVSNRYEYGNSSIGTGMISRVEEQMNSCLSTRLVNTSS